MLPLAYLEVPEVMEHHLPLLVFQSLMPGVVGVALERGLLVQQHRAGLAAEVPEVFMAQRGNLQLLIPEEVVAVVETQIPMLESAALES
jgi:hypothetical protein